jgi:hypothetical protein
VDALLCGGSDVVMTVWLGGKERSCAVYEDQFPAEAQTL